LEVGVVVGWLVVEVWRHWPLTGGFTGGEFMKVWVEGVIVGVWVGVTVADGGGGRGDSWRQGGELVREEEKNGIWEKKGKKMKNTADCKQPAVILQNSLLKHFPLISVQIAYKCKIMCIGRW
jgi:hypothetical protein